MSIRENQKVKEILGTKNEVGTEDWAVLEEVGLGRGQTRGGGHDARARVFSSLRRVVESESPSHKLGTVK